MTVCTRMGQCHTCGCLATRLAGRDAPTGKPAWYPLTRSFMNLDSGERGKTSGPSSLPCLPSPNSIARGKGRNLNGGTPLSF
uniref:Uncharacterized protein n=1 Tax=Catagonus wagneri TaxID=51154 RepID=A0A8C3W219_9CETA